LQRKQLDLDNCEEMMGLKIGDVSPVGAAITGEGFASNFGLLPAMHARDKKKEKEAEEAERKKQSGMKKGGKVDKYAKGGDVQSESSKLDQKNAEMDKAQEEGYKRYQAEQAKEAKANADSRKSMPSFNFGKPEKKAKGGAIKSSASSRADGCAQRGKTKGRMV
jgi:hypothetical protein